MVHCGVQGDEFWYYVLFPLLFVAVTTQGPSRLCSAVGAMMLFYMLLDWLVLYGLIWLLGIGAYKTGKSSVAISAYRKLLFVASGLLLTIALVLTRTAALTGVTGDFAVGVTFALMLVPLSKMRPRS